MTTFFARVEDTDIERIASDAAERVADAYAHHREPTDEDAEACERNATVFWIGADFIGQIPTVEMLAEQLKVYAEITPALIEQLHADQQAAEARPRTTHQQMMQQFVTENAPR
jgi:hypothetical protein